jgi:transposase
MSATHSLDCTVSAQVKLYVALELGWNSWKLALTTGMGQKPRIVNIGGRDVEALKREIEAAKLRFGLAATVPVVSCYEAGRDGFWLHRWLTQEGITNHVVDASSIEVKRRARRAKSDKIDVCNLLTMLIRFCLGEKSLWSVVYVPSPEDEDRRQVQRDLMALKGERTEHVNRIKALLATVGIDIIVNDNMPKRVDDLRQWDGTPVPTELRGRLLREFERWQLVDRQVSELTKRQRQEIRDDSKPKIEKVRKLLDIRGIGPVSAWLLVNEVFGWRPIKNGRRLASLVGLAPTPYQSGTSYREQGISKAGNKRVRWVMVELAWMWLRYQPQSRLSRWYQRRFGHGNARARKIGIVALARKLLIALWRYLEQGEVPEKATLVSWQQKVKHQVSA